jgi:hypothetical protein
VSIEHGSPVFLADAFDLVELRPQPGVGERFIRQVHRLELHGVRRVPFGVELAGQLHVGCLDGVGIGLRLDPKHGIMVLELPCQWSGHQSLYRQILPKG